mgnify:CR=1 FL=1
MTNVQDAHAQYRVQMNKINETQQDIAKVDDAIQALQDQINVAKEEITIINDSLTTAAVDIATDSLTSDQYMTLKKDLRDQNGVIEDLSEVITMQEEVKARLIGSDANRLDRIKNAQKEIALGIKPIETLRDEQNKLSYLKKDLISQLTKQAISKAVLAAKDEIKELSFLIASDEKYIRAYDELGGELYTDLGKALCLSAFDAKEGVDYSDATFQQARNECEVIIEDLNTYTLATK